MSEQWYKDGLKFSCKRCTYCCTFTGGGYIWVSKKEIEKIASNLNLSLNNFGKKYLKKFHGQYSLLEKPNGECIMYENGGCKIYEFRPTQCIAFPFWPENMRSQETWEALKKTCPGINEGKLFSCEEITKILENN